MTQTRDCIAPVYLRGRVVGDAVVWREVPPEVTLCVPVQAVLDAALDSILGGRGFEVQMPPRITINGSEPST